jgi:ATP-binding cassette, subfamily B, bacterial
LRETWRALRLLVGTSVRTEPWRSAAALLEPLSRLSFPLLAIWLKLLTDGVVERNIAHIVIGVAGIAMIQSLLFVASLIGNDMRIILSERVGFAFDQELARLVAGIRGLEHLERADYRDKLELLRQSQTALGGSLNGLLNVVNAVVGALATLVVLASLNPMLLWLALFALPAIPVARMQQQWQKEGEERSAAPSRLARHLRGLTTDRNAGMELRVFGLQDEIRARFRSAAFDARRPLLRIERRIAWTNTGRQIFFVVGYVGAITFVLRRAVNGQATVGDVVAAVYLCRQVAQMVVWPIFSVAQLGTILRAAGRFLWLRDYADSANGQRASDSIPPERLSAGITFENVSFTYPGTDRPVLRDLSLTIPAGAVIALVGENGAGKTTVVKLLARMYEPTEGRILIDGVNLADIDSEKWRQRLSAAFQDFAKPELVAQHTVGIGNLIHLDDETNVLTGLHRAGSGDVVDALPDGLSTQLGSSWTEGIDLSTGQWQKLALGRALMRNDPLMVFFDEPTASLDAPTEHALFQRYAEAARSGSEAGSITILVSHRFSTVRSADLILVLDHGRPAELGRHEELVERSGIYAQLYNLQAKSYS